MQAVHEYICNNMTAYTWEEQSWDLPREMALEGEEGEVAEEGGRVVEGVGRMMVGGERTHNQCCSRYYYPPPVPRPR